MKKLLPEKNNGSNKHKKKINKRNKYLNFFKKTNNELKDLNKHYKKSRNNTNKIKYNFEFNCSVCLKIFHYLIIILIMIKLNNQYKAKIADRYDYRCKKIIENNRTYNESNLITFEDKLNWLTIHDSTSLKGKCADKIMLHKYSKYILVKDYCNKIIKIYDNTSQINLSELPDQFVFKANHGSSFNKIVYNKSKLRFKVNLFLKITGEFYYSLIKRKLFAEEFIGSRLKNFKFLCYNGKPKYVYVSIKQGYNKYRNFYDMDWNLLNFKCLSRPHPYYKYEKPKFFELMKEYAKIFSKDFKFVRVDFYELENEIRLGELTFTPMNSFFFCKNKKDEIELGKYINTKLE
jgi:hypothetical protein